MTASARQASAFRPGKESAKPVRASSGAIDQSSAVAREHQPCEPFPTASASSATCDAQAPYPVVRADGPVFLVLSCCNYPCHKKHLQVLHCCATITACLRSPTPCDFASRTSTLTCCAGWRAMSIQRGIFNDCLQCLPSGQAARIVQCRPAQKGRAPSSMQVMRRRDRKEVAPRESRARNCCSA